MKRFTTFTLSLFAAAALTLVGASSASAKPHKSNKAQKTKKAKKTVVHTKKGKKVVVVERGNRTTVRYGKKAPIKYGKHGKFGTQVKYGPTAKQRWGSGKWSNRGVLASYLSPRLAPRNQVRRNARITRYERRLIARAQTKLSRMQARFWADGFLSKYERRSLQRQKFKVQRTIDRAYRS